MFISDLDQIPMGPKVSDPYGSGSGSDSTTLQPDIDAVFENNYYIQITETGFTG
jgi:hypothetical protein